MKESATHQQICQQNMQLRCHSAQASKTIQKSINFGYWTDEQHAKYVAFIDYFRRVLNSKLKRRNNKIFKQMASIIKTRTPTQCRSHHIKQVRTFKSLQNIVNKTKRKTDPKRFEQLVELIKHEYNNKTNTSNSQIYQIQKISICTQTILPSYVGYQSQYFFIPVAIDPYINSMNFFNYIKIENMNAN